jgi:hypothetical protein
MEHPLLYLGLMGFDAASEASVRTWVASNASNTPPDDHAGDAHPVWRVVDYREADALLIRGAGIVHCLGSHIKFAAHQPAAQAAAPLGADLNGITQPFALSDVAHLQGLGVDTNAHRMVDLASPTSMLHTLQHFESLLRPLRTLFTLAAELSERREEMDGEHTFHIDRQGTLDAIIDPPRRRVLLRPGTRPVDITSNAWLRRPKSANFAPAHFVECSMDELAWVFAMHTASLNLPARYLKKLLYLRHSPRIRHSLLRPRHAALLECLCAGAATFEQLRKELPDSAHWIERDLLALYLVRSITTTAPVEQFDSPSSLPFGTSSQGVPASQQLLGRRLSTMSGNLQSLF